MAYGFEFRDASGVPRLTLTEAPPLLVFSQRFAASFTGSVSIPAFDSEKGGYFVKACAIKAAQVYAPFLDRISDATPLNSAGREIGLQSVAHPLLSWNNATKVMSISAGPAVTQGAIFGIFRDPFAIPDYYLICMHGNLVF